MVGLEDRGINRLTQPVGSEPERREFLVGVHRIMHQYFNALGLQDLDGGEHTRERGLLHPAPVGGAQYHHTPALQVTQHTLGQTDRIPGHGHVRLAGGTHDRGLRVGVEVEARVDGDAVPADGDAGPVDVAVGLRVGGVDDLRVRVQVLQQPARSQRVDDDHVRQAQQLQAAGGGEAGGGGGV